MAHSDRGVRPGSLQIRSHQAGTTYFLTLSGELDHVHCPAVDAELIRLGSNGAEHIVVDLSEVDFIDSTGIGLLVEAMHREKGKDRLRFIRSQSEHVERLLEICGLEAHFPKWIGPVEVESAV